MIQPATLAQVAADDGLLRRLDADPTHPYSVKASDLQHVSVLLAASPTCLSRRMRLVESHLAGANKMVLTVAPSMQAERWKAAKLPAAQVWLQPFETIEARSHLDAKSLQSRLIAMLPFYGERSAPLLKGRMLHLKGKLVGPEGAIHYYQMARPSNQDLLESPMHPLAKQLHALAKQDAGYWSGLILYHRANYPAAVDYFTTRTLLAVPNGPWTFGARYNLARAYEASGETKRAILQYQSNDILPDYSGNLLRAKWLGQPPP